MNLKEKLSKAWEKRKEIADGFYHKYISCSKELEQEAQRRLKICESNTCGMWDSTGTNEKLVIKGKPGCALCGCVGDLKIRCFQCQCTLGDINPETNQPYGEPLWGPVITQEQANEYNEIAYRKQFEQ